MHGGVTGKASDGLPMSIFSIAELFYDAKLRWKHATVGGFVIVLNYNAEANRHFIRKGFNVR
jgi:hypothetical protein